MLWMICILAKCCISKLITERVRKVSLMNVFVSDMNFLHLLSAGDWGATVRQQERIYGDFSQRNAELSLVAKTKMR